MLKLNRLALATTFATVALSVAGPAIAAMSTFANYTQASTAPTMYWKANAAGTGGSLYSIGSNGSTGAGFAAVSFAFLQPALAVLGPLKAKFTFLDTTVTTPADLTYGYLFQTLTSGAFSFKYTGLAPLVVGSATYLTGANLLSATFSTATIFGASNALSGSVTASSLTATIVYTSDFLDFSSTAAQDFSLGLTSISPALNRPNAASALRTFKASSTGAFSTDPAPLVPAVPEPATWMLMLVGFGMIGFSTRRRSPAVSA